MVPALPPRTLVVATGYFWKPRPGHVVIIAHQGKEKIKRIDKVKDNQIFVLGDHPETSTDSRQFGWLPVAVIKGRIILPRTPRN